MLSRFNRFHHSPEIMNYFSLQHKALVSVSLLNMDSQCCFMDYFGKSEQNLVMNHRYKETCVCVCVRVHGCVSMCSYFVFHFSYFYHD